MRSIPNEFFDLQLELRKAASFDETRKLTQEQPDFVTRLRYTREAKIDTTTIAAFENHVRVFSEEKSKAIEMCGKRVYEEKATLDAILKDMKAWTSPGIFSAFEAGVANLFYYWQEGYYHSTQAILLYEAVDYAQSVSLNRLLSNPNVAQDEKDVVIKAYKALSKAVGELEGIAKRYENDAQNLRKEAKP